MTAQISMSALDPGNRGVGRYRIVSLLGAGGMGEVYDAIDPSLGRHVALKVLKADAVSDPTRVSRFVQEARSASMLNHPHLVSIYEIGEDAGVHFIAMEKVEGATLREMLASERLQPGRAIELMAQITEAVAAAHGAGIIHRDLKPENIMVSRTGYAKVLDFGLAKLQPQTMLSNEASASTVLKATDSGTVLGTVGYMSPEQAQGKAVDARSDIFSLGCILYEMIAGRRAFQATSSIDTLHKIIHEEPPPLRSIVPGILSEVERIVRKSTAKNPEMRYQSARDLAIDLRNARDEVQSPPRAQGRLHPYVIGAIAIAVVVVAIAGALVLLRRPAPKESLEIQRMTSSGDVINAVISPDGKYMAYARYNEVGQSAWVRQLSTNQDLVIIPPNPDKNLSVWGLTFTPDSSRIYCAIRRPGDPAGLLSSVPVIGGQGQQLLAGIDSSVSFSPDGKRITYLRNDFPQAGSSAVMVASSDGSGAHAIDVKRAPDYFSPIWFAQPSWSPDGKTIATAVLTRSFPPRARIVGIDPDDGAEHVIADAGWQHVGGVVWLPDGKALVAIAGRRSFVDTIAGDQDNPLWLVPAGGGAPHPITRDVDAYRRSSITADGSALMSIRLTQPIIELWRVPLTGEQPEKLLAGLQPLPHPACLPSGGIAFAGNGIISVADKGSDGTERVTELVHDRFRNSIPLAFSDGIIYSSLTPEGDTICSTSLAGEGRKVITRGRPMGVTPDGSRITFFRDNALWVRSVADGRETKIYGPASSEFDNAVISPTGHRIAVVRGRTPRRQIDVIDVDSLQTEWTMTVTGDWQYLRWMPDGSALLMTGLLADRGNVWKLDFKSPPSKVTRFYGQLTLDFDISPDGKSLAVVRSQFERDAVLIRGFD